MAPRPGRLRVTVFGATLSLVVPLAATAQAVVVVTPTLAVGTVVDSNVFSLPESETDLVWRIVPGLTMRRDTDRATVSGWYGFTAERFRALSRLNTPLASQGGGLRGLSRLAPTRQLRYSGAYTRSRSPSDFNAVTTGLAVARRPAWHASGGVEVAEDVRANLFITLGYDVAKYALSSAEDLTVLTRRGEDITSHAARLAVTHRRSARVEVGAKYLGERLTFGGSVRPPTVSHVGTLTWARRLTSMTRLTLEAGPRLTSGSMRPEIAAGLVRQFGTSDASLTYAHTQTTALGILQPIALDSLVAEATYRRPGTIEATVRGALYDNRVDAQSIRVSRVSATLIKHLAGIVALSASYEGSRQRGTLHAAPAGLPAVAGDASLIGQAALTRSLLLLQVIVSPTFGRQTGEPDALEPPTPARLPRRIP